MATASTINPSAPDTTTSSLPDLSQTNPFDSASALDSAAPSTTTALQSAEASDASDTLTVDRNATLTLGTDSLIVLDEGLKHRRSAANFCGLLPQFSKTTQAIPFYNILWAELEDFEICIKSARSTGKKGCVVATIRYSVLDKFSHTHASQWIERLLQRAYPADVKRQKRMKVLVNPFGGQGNAQKFWSREVEPIFTAAKCVLDVERTKYRGHAVEIAQTLDVEAYDVVACASGDGLPHEVFNGLAKQSNARRALRKVGVVQIPCGSGNAMSMNFNGTDSPSLAALAILKGVRSPFDLVAVTQGQRRYFSFLSQAVGLIAECDVGTESLRWMGSFRFTWGALVRVLGKSMYPAEVAVVVEEGDKLKVKEGYWRAREEVERAGLKGLDGVEDDDALMESGEVGLPELQYGTVQDPLSEEWVVEDHPTLGNFYVGNMCWMSGDMPFFAPSLPSDGLLDLVCVSASISRATGLRMLVQAESGAMIDFPEVSYRKVRAYRITPRMHQPEAKKKWVVKFGKWLGGAGRQREGLIAVDGERVPWEPFQCEVCRGLGTVLAKRRGLYEFDGPKK